MKSIHLRIDGKVYDLSFSRKGNQLSLRGPFAEDLVFQIQDQDGALVVEGPHGRSQMFVARDGEKAWVMAHGKPLEFERCQPEMSAGPSDDSQAADVTAPMTGKVVRVLTKAGAKLAEGDGVVVVEAMKMEHKLTAPFPSTVDSLNCEEGRQVDMGDILAHLIRLDDPEEHS